MRTGRWSRVEQTTRKFCTGVVGDRARLEAKRRGSDCSGVLEIDPFSPRFLGRGYVSANEIIARRRYVSTCSIRSQPIRAFSRLIIPLVASTTAMINGCSCSSVAAPLSPPTIAKETMLAGRTTLDRRQTARRPVDRGPDFRRSEIK